MSRDVSFCAHAITQDRVMVVPDATLDERFYDNPLVTGPANLRFYAGVPLTSSAGHALGALCIIDGEPHHDFSSDDCERLRELAKMAADRLELRRVEISTEKAGRTLEIFDTNPSTAFVRFDKRREVVARNAAAAALYGYKPDEGFARSFDTLVPERERAVLHDLIARAIGAGSVEGLSVPAKLHGLRRDETEFDLGLYLTCFRKKGDLTFNAHLQDLTALRLEEEELHRLANTDILTTVANRAHFYRQAEKALAGPSSSAVLMIDLDGFKDINDTLGPAVGDGVLCEVARRLEALAGPNDTVARFGGDEFAILLTGLSSAALAHDVARAAIISVAQPIFIAGHEVRVTAGCGIAVAPLHGQEAVELIGNADLALSKAKSIGRGNSFVFVTALRKEAMTRRLFNMELHRALSDDEFVLVYQPQTRLADGALTGAEALIRWLHPKHGLLAPAAFLPALEGGSLAAAVGSWILDEACAQAALWRRSGAPDFRIGVNLFGAQFRTNDLASEVFSTLERHGLPPEALELEVTENIGLDHNVLETLQRLRDCGVGIAFDDFGTGYASLSLLKRYPLSRIKIDRCFVQSMLESERDASVIRAILYMARSFDLETTAEGVETEEQRESLRRLGCEEGQGFLFSRPLPAPQFADTFGIGMPRRMAARA